MQQIHEAITTKARGSPYILCVSSDQGIEILSEIRLCFNVTNTSPETELKLSIANYDDIPHTKKRIMGTTTICTDVINDYIYYPKSFYDIEILDVCIEVLQKEPSHPPFVIGDGSELLNFYNKFLKDVV